MYRAFNYIQTRRYGTKRCYLFTLIVIVYFLMFHFRLHLSPSLENEQHRVRANGTILINTSRILSPYKSRYIIKPSTDYTRDIYLTCVVHSSAEHSDLRMRVRQTWGALGRVVPPPHCDVIVFVLGLTANSSLSASVLQESRTYGDILLGDFIDTYKNLTLKARVSIRYATEYLSHSRFIMKIDDDMFVNTVNLFGYLQQLRNLTDYFISCRVWLNGKVFRKHTSKFYVPREVYKKNVYPPFCAGAAYIMPRGVVQQLEEHTNYVINLPVDDVTVTGLARLESKTKPIKLIDISERYSLRDAENSIAKKGVPTDLIFAHHVHSDLYFHMWSSVVKHHQKI